MKKNRIRKNSSLPDSGRKKSKTSIDADPFFNSNSNRKRKTQNDDFIDSDDSEEEAAASPARGGEEESEVEETADEKRLRVANEYLQKIRALTKRDEDEKEDEDERDGLDVNEEERGGKRDSLVAEILQQEQLEESGRVRRLIASRVQQPETTHGFRIIHRHRQSVTAVALSEDEARGYSASKDGVIFHWDVSSGKSEKYVWPDQKVLISHGAKNPQNSSIKWSKHVLALAVSSDGRYLATGGLDRHVHLWDTRTREHVQAFSGHRGPVSCLTFRQGTSELISGSFDRTIKLWNAEDRSYMDTLFGHQSELLTIDCLRKERVLTVGRDRTMRLWKVPEESQLVFRAPASSLESCCFINNEEFLSGSDDGSIELWSVTRKKPTCIVKNAHASLALHGQLDSKENDEISNGDRSNKTSNCLEDNNFSADGCSSADSAQAWVGAVAVCRGSDLAATGAANGVLRLWGLENAAKSIRPLYDLPLVGYVNALTFAKSGRFLVGGVGQEPRLGRWGRVPAARNGVVIHSLKLSEE